MEIVKLTRRPQSAKARTRSNGSTRNNQPFIVHNLIVTRWRIATELLRGLMKSLDIAIIDPARGLQPTSSFAVDGFCSLSMLRRYRRANVISRAFQLPEQEMAEPGMKEQRQITPEVVNTPEIACPVMSFLSRTSFPDLMSARVSRYAIHGCCQ